MANGKQLAEANFGKFQEWVATKTDDEYRSMESRGVIARKEIAKECGFAKSVLDQNPRVKAALRALEDDLRLRSVLPPAVAHDSDIPQPPLMREPGRVRATEDAERLRRLEQENAALRAEVAELKRAVDKFAVLRDALTQTGRLPR